MLWNFDLFRPRMALPRGDEGQLKNPLKQAQISLAVSLVLLCNATTSKIENASTVGSGLEKVGGPSLDASELS
jgi:hypothetical protein